MFTDQTDLFLLDPELEKDNKLIHPEIGFGETIERLNRIGVLENPENAPIDSNTEFVLHGQMITGGLSTVQFSHARDTAFQLARMRCYEELREGDTIEFSGRIVGSRKGFHGYDTADAAVVKLSPYDAHLYKSDYAYCFAGYTPAEVFSQAQQEQKAQERVANYEQFLRVLEMLKTDEWHTELPEFNPRGKNAFKLKDVFANDFAFDKNGILVKLSGFDDRHPLRGLLFSAERYHQFMSRALNFDLTKGQAARLAFVHMDPARNFGVEYSTHVKHGPVEHGTGIMVTVQEHWGGDENPMDTQYHDYVIDTETLKRPEINIEFVPN